jgi:hypothetical protein
MLVGTWLVWAGPLRDFISILRDNADKQFDDLVESWIRGLIARFDSRGTL